MDNFRFVSGVDAEQFAPVHLQVVLQETVPDGEFRDHVGTVWDKKGEKSEIENLVGEVVMLSLGQMAKVRSPRWFACSFIFTFK